MRTFPKRYDEVSKLPKAHRIYIAKKALTNSPYFTKEEELVIEYMLYIGEIYSGGN